MEIKKQNKVTLTNVKMARPKWVGIGFKIEIVDIKNVPGKIPVVQVDVYSVRENIAFPQRISRDEKLIQKGLWMYKMDALHLEGNIKIR